MKANYIYKRCKINHNCGDVLFNSQSVLWQCCLAGILHFSTVHNIHLFFNILHIIPSWDVCSVRRHQMQCTTHGKRFSFTIIGFHPHKNSTKCLHLSFHFVTWLAKIFQDTTVHIMPLHFLFHLHLLLKIRILQEYISIDDKQNFNIQFPE